MDEVTLMVSLPPVSKSMLRDEFDRDMNYMDPIVVAITTPYPCAMNAWLCGAGWVLHTFKPWSEVVTEVKSQLALPMWADKAGDIAKVIMDNVGYTDNHLTRALKENLPLNDGQRELRHACWLIDDLRRMQRAVEELERQTDRRQNTALAECIPRILETLDNELRRLVLEARQVHLKII